MEVAVASDSVGVAVATPAVSVAVAAPVGVRVAVGPRELVDVAIGITSVAVVPSHPATNNSPIRLVSTFHTAADPCVLMSVFTGQLAFAVL